MATLRTSPNAQSGADSLSRHMSDWLNELNLIDQFRSCASCLHLKPEGTNTKGPLFCNIHMVHPPAPVIVDGCDQYEDATEIPF